MKKVLPLNLIISWCLFISGCFLIDDSPLKDKDGDDLGTPRFASGPVYGNYYPFADGVIDAAGEALGIFMDNVSTAGSLENAAKIVGGDSYMGDAYMAMIQEDIFDYSRRVNIENYDNDRPVNKTLLKAASQIQVLLALYKEDVHLLVKSTITPGSNANGDTVIDKADIRIEDLAGRTVNLGALNSGTYVTASTIMNSYGITFLEKTDDAKAGIDRVVSGEYDAAFFVTAVPSPAFSSIAAGANVILIPARMKDGSKSYDETGSIRAGAYTFQTVDVGDNITIKTLLAAGPNFDDRNVGIFFDYIFAHALEYKSYNSKWENVSLALSQDYMRANPEKCNYRAMCYVSGFPELDPYYIEPRFCSSEGDSAYHDMAVELIWLMSHNMDIDLRERNTTGSWENAYYMMNGDTSAAIVQDDIFPYLVKSEDMYDSMMAASMKKIVPLHYEYVHLLVQDGGINSISNFPGNDINVGPKTSGTFITAMEIIKSYGFIKEDNITYHHDAPSDAVGNVKDGDYDAMFVVSGVPYSRFYSHDTYSLPGNCKLIEPTFNGLMPDYYKTGVIAGGGTAIYEDYPYTGGASGIFGVAEGTYEYLPTIRVRALQVVSPVFDDSDIEIYLKSVFRKSYYMTCPSDPDDPYFSPDPLWISIKKDSFIAADSDYTTYGEDVEGAIEYFIRNPFGWSKNAAKYYLGMFQD